MTPTNSYLPQHHLSVLSQVFHHNVYTWSQIGTKMKEEMNKKLFIIIQSHALFHIKKTKKQLYSSHQN